MPRLRGFLQAVITHLAHHYMTGEVFSMSDLYGEPANIKELRSNSLVYLGLTLICFFIDTIGREMVIEMC